MPAHQNKKWSKLKKIDVTVSQSNIGSCGVQRCECRNGMPKVHVMDIILNTFFSSITVCRV